MKPYALALLLAPVLAPIGLIGWYVMRAKSACELNQRLLRGPRIKGKLQ